MESPGNRFREDMSIKGIGTDKGTRLGAAPAAETRVLQMRIEATRANAGRSAGRPRLPRRVYQTLALLLLAGLFVAASLAAPPSSPSLGLDSAQAASNRGELRDKLDENQRKLGEIRKNIDQAEATKKAALQDISSLDQKIDGLEGELATVTRQRDAAEAKLSETRAELDRLETAIRERQKTLDKARQDLSIQQERVGERAAAIYKGGRVAYVEMLLNTERLLDLINRMDLLNRVIEQDQDVLNEIERLRTKVAREKDSLEQDQAQVAKVEAEQAKTTTRLEELVGLRVATLQELDGARDAKQAIVAKAETDKAAWEKQENSLLAESNSIEAELRSIASTPAAGSVSGTGQMIWPVSGRISSSFGYRVHPIFKTRKMHTGVDLAVGAGTPIKAADAGTVVFAGWRGGYGKTVIISHGGGLTTLYAHQSSLLVSNGQSVGKGSQVGRVGSTGYSTGPHLHFEVRRNGSPVNPLNFL